MGRTIGSEEEERRAGGFDPGNLVDLLLYLQTLEVIKLRLVALERAVDVVVTAKHRRRAGSSSGLLGVRWWGEGGKRGNRVRKGRRGGEDGGRRGKRKGRERNRVKGGEDGGRRAEKQKEEERGGRERREEKGGIEVRGRDRSLEGGTGE